MKGTPVLQATATAMPLARRTLGLQWRWNHGRLYTANRDDSARGTPQKGG